MIWNILVEFYFFLYCLFFCFFFFLIIRRPPRSTLFPTRRSSDRAGQLDALRALGHPLHVLAWARRPGRPDRKSTRLNSSHTVMTYAVFCLKKKKNTTASFHLKKKKKHKTQ